MHAVWAKSTAIAKSPQLRDRFDREAHAISSLNHPNICALYDVGRQDDIDFLVMEYVEGQTLANRLATGALPIDQTLRYASISCARSTPPIARTSSIAI